MLKPIGTYRRPFGLGLRLPKWNVALLLDAAQALDRNDGGACFAKQLRQLLPARHWLTFVDRTNTNNTGTSCTHGDKERMSCLPQGNPPPAPSPPPPPPGPNNDVPRWTPTYNMSESTVVMPCNYTGLYVGALPQP
jgi:hypothetical protein